ncbi:ABC transporter permease [Stappia indica]|uniref:ABC transporter permease n=1 Tax=Stappia indica TaxID=538381 RepID=UPI001CD7ECD7|nr:ABC transporter permease [Stappia indica]MCA1298376.1 ABC transporter permease [Stappia indica]
MAVRAFLRTLRQHRALAVGGTIVGLVTAAAALSLVWTPYPIDVLSVADRLQGPSLAHPFGTDHYGRDMLSMLMVGARTSIAVALLAVGIGALIGVPLGLLAAARGGWLDEALMRLNDLVFAFPALLSAVMITAILGPGAVNAVLAIGIFNIPVFARVARGGALATGSREFVLAARVSGKGQLRITAEHILPNIANLLIVQGTIQFSLGILAEAGLSYVGLGAQPPLASWGRMLNEAQTMMMMAPSLALYPGLAIVLTVLGLNLMGDGLRDALDPRLKRRRSQGMAP